MTDEIVVEANTGDIVELVFLNGDKITGEVTVPPYGNENIRLRTLFAGDTYISLANLKSFTVSKPREESAPYEPQGTGYIWGYVVLDKYEVGVYRSPNGIWHFEGKSGTWARLHDRVTDLNNDKPFQFVRLSEIASAN